MPAPPGQARPDLPNRPEGADRTDFPNRPEGTGRPDPVAVGATRANPPRNPEPSPRRPETPFLAGRDIKTGRRFVLGKELQEIRRLKTATVVLLVVAILSAPLAFYVLKEATRDPVFVELDGLAIPTWAAHQAKDEAAGNRWCLGRCRFRQRSWQSDRGPEETSQAFQQALTGGGWRPWKVAGCPQPNSGGIETCWQRDEYVLNLWVYRAACDVKVKGKPGADVTTPAPGEVEAVCPPTTVQLKVVNQAAFRTSS